MQLCGADLKVWMSQNKLQLNDEKSEALLIMIHNTHQAFHSQS